MTGEVLTLASQFLRDYSTDGDPGSGANKPSKTSGLATFSAIEDRLNTVENKTGGTAGNLVYGTYLELSANLVPAADVMAWVVADTAALNGVYGKVGATGTGSWTRRAPLPGNVVALSPTGGPDNISAAPLSFFNEDDRSALFLLPIVANNTGAMTLNVGGTQWLPLTDQAGANFTAGQIAAPMTLLIYRQDDQYRTLFYANYVALEASAVAAKTAAETAQALAEAAYAGALTAWNDAVTVDKSVGTRDIITGLTIPAGRDHLIVAGRTAIGDSPVHAYKYVASEPAHPGKIQSANLRWYEIFNDSDGVPLSAFDDIADALDWFKTGNKRLFLDTSFDIAAAKAIQMAGPGLITVKNGIVATATVAAHVNKLLQIDCNGFNLRMDGEWTIDGANLANNPLYILTSTGNPDLYIEATKVANAKMVVGVVGGAFATLIAGGFNRVDWLYPYCDGVSREAGTGVGGSYGSQGNVVTSLAGVYPKRVWMQRAVARNVTTEDADGVAAAIDCDGTVVVQGANNTDSSCIIEAYEGKDCKGRTLKLQTDGFTVLGPALVERSINGITGGSTDVNVQFGHGMVGPVKCRYTGGAHAAGTTPAAFYRTAAPAGQNPIAVLGGLDIDDQSTGAERIGYAVDISRGYTMGVRSQFEVANIRVTGKAISHLVNAGEVGATQYAMVNLSNIEADIVTALIRCTTNTPYLRASYTNVVNTGATTANVPVIVRHDAASLGNSWGHHFDLGGNRGVLKCDGRASGTPGLNAGPGAGGYPVSETLSDAGGHRPQGTQALASAATAQFTPPGYSAGYGQLELKIDGYGAGLYHIAGNTIEDTRPISGVTTSDTGTEPGSGTFRMWVASGVINLKSYDGSSRRVTANLFG